MDRTSKVVTRKDALVNFIVLPALAGLVAVAAPGMASADNDPRVTLKYQSTPKNGQKCSNCTLWVAGKTPTAMGTCKVITGPISPNGWCTAFNAVTK
jgi:hypothetical protein